MQHKVLGGRHCEQCAYHPQLHSLAIALAALLDQGHHLHSAVAFIQVVLRSWASSRWQAFLLLLLRFDIGEGTCDRYQAFACNSDPALDSWCTRLRVHCP